MTTSTDSTRPIDGAENASDLSQPGCSEPRPSAPLPELVQLRPVEPAPAPSATSEPRGTTEFAAGPVGRTGLPGRVATELETVLGRQLAAGLHLVATPIGHLADITLRALATLAQADLVLCEDTRHSLKLLSHYGITTRLEPYHEHNAHLARPRVLRALNQGLRVALISDAGTPLVSDPGYKLVRAALHAGHRVSALPGPSAALAALTMSGLPTDCFTFVGFLPPRSASRQTRLKALTSLPGTLILFEAPTRVAATLADIATVLGDRPVVLARELTKLHEAVRAGTASNLAAALATEAPRGECVLLIGQAEAAEIDDETVAEHLQVALQSQSVSAAARSVACDLDLPKSRVYALALGLQRGPNPTAGKSTGGKPARDTPAGDTGEGGP